MVRDRVRASVSIVSSHHLLCTLSSFHSSFLLLSLNLFQGGNDCDRSDGDDVEKSSSVGIEVPTEDVSSLCSSDSCVDGLSLLNSDAHDPVTGVGKTRDALGEGSELDRPCSACEMDSTGYASYNCGCRVGRRAYSVYDMVESRDVKWLFILRVSSVFERALTGPWPCAP